MQNPTSLFTRFDADISQYSLPERFTFPFYYQPHPLCELASEQLQRHLNTQQEWSHDFGLEKSSRDATGKMFGVLLVKNAAGELGFLSAFSGKIADQNHLSGFVPPVFDMLSSDSFFKAELQEITDINTEVSNLSALPELAQLKARVKTETEQAEQAIEALRLAMIDSRAQRKQQRKEAQQTLMAEALQNLVDDLGRQSVAEKNQLKYLKLEWEQRLSQTKAELETITNKLEALKEKRKELSNALQHKLFDQYRFLNGNGVEKSLIDIFEATDNPIPPAGSGECAAPKLLHFAFLHGYQPIAMAEFWWGISPKSEIRQHKYYYPSCQSKCHPILSHMLEGLKVDDNPLLDNPAEGKELDILYQDEAMVIVNKPAGFLSVPGKHIKDSAYTRVQALFPDVEGPYVIHRLDMATSGLLVFALTKRANKSLQKQFITRSVQKRYVALIEGELSQNEGKVELPLRGDLYDRPRQLVCFEHGKHAETTWQVIDQYDGKTKLYLHPKTGRTHQLRMHCAHHLGLGMPIVGDALYGKKSQRLHLHAESLVLDHPYTKERMTFQADPEF
ncbi:RluA family pseudouridine synthase [Vibrio paucivorans]|uniref:Pseudouridine synthase n=1 Tax=Vibrio paucivorans TaxID=2829489 RepID=A0A9X3CH06_9VIBR|nr:RluA family pseudouridine synthase [Vibrio paucivorans]MCW8335674.1 pseudouridine synthase [Vibrio paucivorans]